MKNLHRLSLTAFLLSLSIFALPAVSFAPLAAQTKTASSPQTSTGPQTTSSPPSSSGPQVSSGPQTTSGSPSSSGSGELLLMFWNLENFFDYIDGGTSESDKEFSAHGTRHWGRKKFQAKCAAIAKTLMWAGDREGRMPDVFAVAEVENRYVLRRLIEDTMLRKYGYEIVHYDSPDPRGIDVALLYRPQSLEFLESRPVRVHGTLSAGLAGSSAAGPSGSSAVPSQGTPTLVTRDILMTKFRVPASGPWNGIGGDESGVAGRTTLSAGHTSVLSPGDTLAVLVNHHPSKYGGGDTDWRREAALARLKALKDSLVAAGVTKVVATGDFNDVPENTHFSDDVIPSAGSGFPESFTTPFINLAAPLSARGEGTIRFDGKWQLIDMFLVTPALLGEPSDPESKALRSDPEGKALQSDPEGFFDPSLPARKDPTRLEMEILHPPFLTVRDNVHSGDKPLRTYSGPRYIGGVSDHRPVILRLGLGAGSAERESDSVNGPDGGYGEGSSDSFGNANANGNANGNASANANADASANANGNTNGN